MESQSKAKAKPSKKVRQNRKRRASSSPSKTSEDITQINVDIKIESTSPSVSSSSKSRTQSKLQQKNTSSSSSSKKATTTKTFSSRTGNRKPRERRCRIPKDQNKKRSFTYQNWRYYRNRAWKRNEYSKISFSNSTYSKNFQRNCHQNGFHHIFELNNFQPEVSFNNYTNGNFSEEIKSQQWSIPPLNELIAPETENSLLKIQTQQINNDCQEKSPVNLEQTSAFQPIDQIVDNQEEEAPFISYKQENSPKQFEQINSDSTTPVIDNNFFPISIKYERPSTDFDLATSISDTQQLGSISVVPISRLIKCEIQDLNRSDIDIPNTSLRNKNSPRPNLIQRKKSISNDGQASLSENLVQRVVNMDKVSIKNVINSSGTKYDAALKIQARKRLREEIRKQLKSMNFTPPEDNENNVLIPDEIVDSMNIPAVVLDEIRKAFGIVLVEDKKPKMIVDEATEQTIQDSPKTTSAVNNSTQAEPDKSPKLQKSPKPPKSPDLMSRIKMLEECKSQSEKIHPKKTEKPPQRSKSTEPIFVIDSSSSSSCSSSSSSDSDTSSTSSESNSSRSSSFRRRRRKKRILEANVVGNFEKLILPNLTPSQRRRYKEKYSKSTKNSLLFIHEICVNKAKCNKDSISKDKSEQLKLKKNLSSADNAQALEFLMKSILSLFEQQKENLRKNKINQNLTTKSKIKSPTNLISKTRNSTEETTFRRLSESANSEESLKHQSTHKLDKVPTKARVNKRRDNFTTEIANSTKRVHLSDDMSPVVLDIESDTEPTNIEKPPLLASTLNLSNIGSIQTSSSAEDVSNRLGVVQSSLSTSSFDLEALRSQSSIGDEAVNSIREIDVKLMELHKRKMYIEEMILKLQKDKMEVDMCTMKLQNEKFILLNSALANASNTNSSVSVGKEFCEKRKSSPISEQPKNMKKHCQKNIIPFKANSAIQEIISKIGLKPKIERRRTNSSKDGDNSERNSTSISSKTAKISDLNCEPAAKIVTNSEENGQPNTATTVKENEDDKYVEVAKTDYSNVENGSLEGWKLPITQIIVVGEAIIAASEDGNIYKFNIKTRELESKFSKHTEAITQIFSCPRENFIYTTSLDGFLKKTSIENFGLEIQSLNLQEPLQSIDIEWNTAFIGSRWGNIFTYNIKNNVVSESLLCSSGSSIIAIKATKEGPRKILIVSSKGNLINFRDAMTGLLLRSLDVPDNLHIYSVLLDEGFIYCGTQRNEIHQYDFTNGGHLAIFKCGNGAVSMKMYKEKYIFVGCYDGFVYVLDKKTGCQIGRFPGSGKMILSLEIAGDKLITSAKDNTMQIVDVPKYIATLKDKN